VFTDWLFAEIGTKFVEALERVFKRALDLGRDRKTSISTPHRSGAFSYGKH
jgi:hypothetical protein